MLYASYDRVYAGHDGRLGVWSCGSVSIVDLILQMDH
jgi:hypothetical protein